ncbi:MAG TPA: polysaccharide deacetylase family protein [Oscillospiraceae bacterium]|nr:polysaccharide deacetylase family protein [Oscillospiraceae bacterium]HPF55417.1 polysaccharide deacetylase family protein [Clostridiales bacterium]HPK34453.1 polysaccharide deacetylase family protein [Oscillospiraceae bacterium]HPR76433.1 polysaccharide deacetylase family protein [Oscillospiraceae bacterium]
MLKKLIIGVLLVSALSSQGLSWYPHRIKGTATPAVMPEASAFFSQYNAVFMGSPDEKKVYLTFDSGYENGCTAKILGVLKAKGVKAAFFLDGNYLRRNPDLVRQMAEDGHLVCNHTLKHPDMTKFTDFEQYKMQLLEWEALAQQVGIKTSPFYRPPSGRFSELSLSFDKELGYKTVFWSVAYADWDPDKQLPEQKALSILKNRTHNGAIILLHSVSSTNTAILGSYIDWLVSEGYSLNSLDEL